MCSEISTISFSDKQMNLLLTPPTGQIPRIAHPEVDFVDDGGGERARKGLPPEVVHDELFVGWTEPETRGESKQDSHSVFGRSRH